MRTHPQPRPWWAGLVIAGLVTTGTSDVRADVLCVKRSGLVVSRATCRAKERAFDPAALGLVGPAGPDGPPGEAGPPGEPGGHPYRVVDATGKTFGTLLAFDNREAQVVVTPPGVDHPVQFVVAYHDFSRDQATVWYQTSSCTGPPFVNGSVGLAPYAVVVGDRAYFATAPPVGVVAIGSYEEERDPCPTGSVVTGRGTCCTPFNTTRSAAQARAVPLASLGVTPPFTVEP